MTALPTSALTALPARVAPATPDWVSSFNRSAPLRPASVIFTHPARDIRRAPPSHAEPRLHWRFASRRRASLPPSFCATIPGARVWGLEGAVIAPDGSLLADVSAAFARPPQQHPIFSETSLPEPRYLRGRSLLLTARGGFRNYYHWILDVLPRLHLAELVGRSLEDFDHIIVSSRRLPYQRETLARLGLDDARLIESVEEPHLLAEELVLPSLARHQGETMPWGVGWLERLFAREIGEGAAEARSRGRGRRLYSSRGDAKYRRVGNEAGLWEALRGLGFERVESSGMSVSEQARLFAGAEAVVGAHGANLTNLVFCRKGTQVVELCPPALVIPPFWALSHLKGLKHTYVVGEGEDFFPPEEDEVDSFGDFRMDVEKVRRILVEQVLNR